MSGLQQVHLRFNDQAGHPVACRVRVTDPAGNYYAPFGRLTKFATEPGVDVGANVLLDGEAWAIIDGACEIAVPPGPLKVQARKGPEYRPLDADVVLQPGKMSLRFVVERWADHRAFGFYSGDTCCYELSPHAAMLEAAATDVDVVDLLIREHKPEAQARDDLSLACASGSYGAPSLVNIAAYSGQHPALEKSGRLVVVNTANQSPHGRLLLLNTHRIVYPLSFQAGDKWSLLDWCDQCHRKKGLVVADDWLPRLANGPVPELLDADFLRRVDAIRFHPDVPLEPWWDAQRRGFALPFVGGSGKESNRELIGSWRTYASVPFQPLPGRVAALGDVTQQPLDYATWTEAVRAGKTFVTNGPLLVWGFGDRWDVLAWSHSPLDRLQVVQDGKVVAESTGPSERLRIECDVQGSFVARCEGPDGALAVSSPIASTD